MEGVEELKTMVFEAFRNATPHLCDPSKIRGLLKEVVNQATSLDEIIGRLQEEMGKRSVATERTDLKILLLFLEREAKKQRSIN